MPKFECPTCRKTFKKERAEEAPFRPFCCSRCKLVDLGRWLDGTYSISEPMDAEDPDHIAPPNDSTDTT